MSKSDNSFFRTLLDEKDLAFAWLRASHNIRIIQKEAPTLHAYYADEMAEVKEIEDRIQGLERQRAEELENRRWMSSCPDRPNSFGKYAFFEKSECMKTWVYLLLHINTSHNRLHCFRML